MNRLRKPGQDVATARQGRCSQHVGWYTPLHPTSVLSTSAVTPHRANDIFVDDDYAESGNNDNDYNDDD